MEKVIVVDGYAFTDENMAKQAANEAEGVKYAKARTDLSRPQQVLTIYNKMLQQRMFQTQVGYHYLKELQEYLKTMPAIRSEDIKPIPVAANLMVEDTSGLTSFWRKKLGREQRKFRMSVGLNLILAVAILVMFIIAATGENATVLNYEQQLQDRYATWEQELTKREDAVRAKEQELDLE